MLTFLLSYLSSNESASLNPMLATCAAVTVGSEPSIIHVGLGGKLSG